MTSGGPPVPRRLVPMAEVADVERSIAFYARLGFAVRNTFTPDGEDAPAWAYLDTDQAHLMVARAEQASGVPASPRVLFYLYFDDISAVHARLGAAGLDVGEMTFPFYNPDGEFRMLDPDGYSLMLTHT